MPMSPLCGTFSGIDIFSQTAWEWTFDQGRLEQSRRLEAAIAVKLPESKRFWAGPALCDPQINGGLGYSFGSPGVDPAPFLQLIRHLRRLGIAWFLPTLITDRLENLADAFRTLESFRRANPQEIAYACPGYHLEGPWISPENGFRGAHPADCVLDPRIEDFDRLQEAANGRIVMVTLAPERPGALELIHHLVRKGVRVALGHTEATASAIRAAVDRGAAFSTHLGNGLAKTIDRHANPLWVQLATEDLTASFIPDGHHLPAEFIRCLFACKPAGRAVVTADSSPVAGLPAGTYPLWNGTVEVNPEGRVSLPGSALLAGSGCFTDHCVRFLLRSGLATLPDALAMASLHTGQALSLPPPYDLEKGTFVLFRHHGDNPWEPHLVCVQGKGQAVLPNLNFP